MSTENLLLVNGFFLSVVLLILLILFERESPKPSNKKVKEDIKKIKEQVEGKK